MDWMIDAVVGIVVASVFLRALPAVALVKSPGMVEGSR
jgi:hypothetical protein